MVISKTPDCNSSKVTQFVSSYVPESRLSSEISAELTYTLPQNSSSTFPQLFDAIQREKSNLAIGGYGMSITTMEEVFLKVGNESSSQTEDCCSEDIIDENYARCKYSKYRL